MIILLAMEYSLAQGATGRGKSRPPGPVGRSVRVEVWKGLGWSRRGVRRNESVSTRDAGARPCLRRRVGANSRWEHRQRQNQNPARRPIEGAVTRRCHDAARAAGNVRPKATWSSETTPQKAELSARASKRTVNQAFRHGAICARTASRHAAVLHAPASTLSRRTRGFGPNSQHPHNRGSTLALQGLSRSSGGATSFTQRQLCPRLNSTAA